MAIGNVTPDSFYPASRIASEQALIAWAHAAVADGADILDIGACSTRPGSTPVDIETEWSRLEPALKALRNALPEVPLSVDTFRPEIARRALDGFGSLIINDISGGNEEMYSLIRAYRVPYVWTLREDSSVLHHKMPELADLELIIDPGFGFLGSTEADYERLRHLDDFRAYHRPILVGLSRKSMIWRPLGITPETSLSATQVLHFYALEHGAGILRVHDVKEAAQTILLYEQITNNTL